MFHGLMNNPVLRHLASTKLREKPVLWYKSYLRADRQTERQGRGIDEFCQHPVSNASKRKTKNQ